MAVRAVLFDLDDTLYDYSRCARSALLDAAQLDERLAAVAPDALMAAHHQLLNELHPQVTAGTLTLEQARQQRFSGLLLRFGGNPDLAPAIAEVFRSALMQEERLVPGTLPLLAALRQQGYPLGIVSNNTRDEQIGKLSRLGILDRFATIVVSADHAAAKPDPRLFHVALTALGVGSDEAVFVGDNWWIDVIGALSTGLRPVWFNRFALAPGDGRAVAQLSGYDDTGHAVRVILGGALPC